MLETGSRSHTIDYHTPLCHTAVMLRLSKKFVAVMLLLWLPVFTGNALATSIIMQMPVGHCHDDSMQMDDMDIGGMDMGSPLMADAADEHNPSCNACAVCHLACTAYLAVPDVEMVAVQTSALETTPYLVDFHSHISTPLLPPPLVHA